MGHDLIELYWNKVQQFLDRGKSQTYADNAAFNDLLPVWRGRLRRTYLERLKWIHRIKLDAVHRKVTKTLRRFIDEDFVSNDKENEDGKSRVLGPGTKDLRNESSSQRTCSYTF